MTGSGESAHMKEFAQRRIRMIQAERDGILHTIEQLMCRDEELLAQINGLQVHLGHEAITATGIQRPRLQVLEGGES